jgi:hypothetical protein
MPEWGRPLSEQPRCIAGRTTDQASAQLEEPLVGVGQPPEFGLRPRVGQAAFDELGDAPRPGPRSSGRVLHFSMRLTTHRRGGLPESGWGRAWFGSPLASHGFTGTAPFPGSIAEGGWGIFALLTSNR